MKKTARTQKLQFSSETIRPLTTDELLRVAGGEMNDGTDACPIINDTNVQTCTCKTGCSHR